MDRFSFRAAAAQQQDNHTVCHARICECAGDRAASTVQNAYGRNAFYT